MAIIVLEKARTKLFQIDQTSPSRMSIQKLLNCGLDGYHAGGNLNISRGVFNDTEKIQYTGNRKTATIAMDVAYQITLRPQEPPSRLIGRSPFSSV
jgi:hypothetical protein